MTVPAQLIRLRSLILDMDGVLYRGNAPTRGAGEFLDFLHQMGIPFVLLTNNSTLTAAQYAAKLAHMGIDAEEDRILTSAEATARHLAGIAPPGTKVYAIGEDGVHRELEKRGFVLRDDADVAYVVAGFDRHVSYRKLAVATLAIRAGATFIGTNPDKTFPSELGQLPGAGAILAAIEAATDMTPLIIGKPKPAIFELALQKLAAEAETTAMVGDRLDTDILGGHQLGLTTILLLSGVTDAQHLAGSPIAPDLVYEDIAALHDSWREAVAA
jgi:4-nitrophenyl phosphatase